MIWDGLYTIVIFVLIFLKCKQLQFLKVSSVFEFKSELFKFESAFFGKFSNDMSFQIIWTCIWTYLEFDFKHKHCGKKKKCFNEFFLKRCYFSYVLVVVLLTLSYKFV